MGRTEGQAGDILVLNFCVQFLDQNRKSHSGPFFTQFI